MMNEMEQMMLQIWLGRLRAMLDGGDVAGVISELDIALTRIAEDRHGIDNNDGAEGSSTAESGERSAEVAGQEGRPEGSDSAGNTGGFTEQVGILPSGTQLPAGETGEDTDSH